MQGVKNRNTMSLRLTILALFFSLQLLSQTDTNPVPTIRPQFSILDFHFPVKDSLSTSDMYKVQSVDYNAIYQSSLGIFCKGENHLSKNAPVNFRMRLGSLEYVDRLEGKIR